MANPVSPIQPHDESPTINDNNEEEVEHGIGITQALSQESSPELLTSDNEENNLVSHSTPALEGIII